MTNCFCFRVSRTYHVSLALAIMLVMLVAGRAHAWCPLDSPVFVPLLLLLLMVVVPTVLLVVCRGASARLCFCAMTVPLLERPGPNRHNGSAAGAAARARVRGRRRRR